MLSSYQLIQLSFAKLPVWTNTEHEKLSVSTKNAVSLNMPAQPPPHTTSPSKKKTKKLTASSGTTLSPKAASTKKIANYPGCSQHKNIKPKKTKPSSSSSQQKMKIKPVEKAGAGHYCPQSALSHSLPTKEKWAGTGGQLSGGQKGGQNRVLQASSPISPAYDLSQVYKCSHFPGLLQSPQVITQQGLTSKTPQPQTGVGRGRPAGSGTSSTISQNQNPPQSGVSQQPGIVASMAPHSSQPKGFNNTPTSTTSKVANQMMNSNPPVTGPMSMTTPASIGMSMPSMMSSSPTSFGGKMGKMAALRSVKRADDEEEVLVPRTPGASKGPGMAGMPPGTSVPGTEKPIQIAAPYETTVSDNKSGPLPGDSPPGMNKGIKMPTYGTFGGMIPQNLGYGGQMTPSPIAQPSMSYTPQNSYNRRQGRQNPVQLNRNPGYGFNTRPQQRPPTVPSPQQPRNQQNRLRQPQPRVQQPRGRGMR